VKAAETGNDVICGSITNANPHSRVSRAEQLLMFNEFLPDLPQKPAWFSLSGNMVLRRSAYERFGPFVEVRAAEDIVFSRRLIAAGGTILFYPALQVAHDNRTGVRSYLRNQLLLGKYTAIARRLVPFADTQSYALFLLLLPISPLAKLAKIVLRLARWHPRGLEKVWQEFPLLFIGICTYCIGLGVGTASRVPRGCSGDA
jgi:GT2 family glycosyltransferase